MTLQVARTPPIPEATYQQALGERQRTNALQAGVRRTVCAGGGGRRAARSSIAGLLPALPTCSLMPQPRWSPRPQTAVGRANPPSSLRSPGNEKGFLGFGISGRLVAAARGRAVLRSGWAPSPSLARLAQEAATQTRLPHGEAAVRVEGCKVCTPHSCTEEGASSTCARCAPVGVPQTAGGSCGRKSAGDAVLDREKKKWIKYCLRCGKEEKSGPETLASKD